eukprot:GILJ01028778.1.p1 GENE.GILJ01028778.1~~GILJ01028778.1.p1  ORF type:complete len:203 (-),score=16.53 GILJ01028778.1:134-742(-)
MDQVSWNEAVSFECANNLCRCSTGLKSVMDITTATIRQDTEMVRVFGTIRIERKSSEDHEKLFITDSQVDSVKLRTLIQNGNYVVLEGSSVVVTGVIYRDAVQTLIAHSVSPLSRTLQQRLIRSHKQSRYFPLSPKSVSLTSLKNMRIDIEHQNRDALKCVQLPRIQEEAEAHSGEWNEIVTQIAQNPSMLDGNAKRKLFLY